MLTNSGRGSDISYPSANTGKAIIWIFSCYSNECGRCIVYKIHVPHLCPKLVTFRLRNAEPLLSDDCGLRNSGSSV
jgi:hypothetical protein